MFNKLQIKIKPKGKLAAVNEKNFGILAANSNCDKENIISAHVLGRVHKSSTHGQDGQNLCSVGAIRWEFILMAVAWITYASVLMPRLQTFPKFVVFAKFVVFVTHNQ